MGRFSLDSRSLAQIRQNRILGVDLYGIILKKHHSRLLPEIVHFIPYEKGFSQSNQQLIKPYWTSIKPVT